MKSPPGLLRPRRTTRSRNNYDQEQEIEIQQRNARSQQKKRTRGKPVAQREAMTSDDASTESDDTNAANLVKELKVKEEFSAALAEVQQELQTLAERPLPEPCARNGHDEILREVQSLREEISTPAPASSPSYADVAPHPPPPPTQSPEQHTDSLNVEHNTNHFNRHAVLHDRHLEDDRKRK
ncbi:hypothetical protein N7457_004938 [Penicillium paradoxum]|uniref:uncharacterized protein n=1 Tax=Penicillium paradoxum TaxID=176176 RepID=UPI0025469FF7|nr:uncharacterized protein N7457_004938 [Penicillium paradoxum]KAJ5783164.1 hypothetical protein N7457_004938 [Penicillium paradoxum]